MTEANPYESPESPYTVPGPIVTEGKQRGPSGLGGWLILVGIGIVLSPIRLGIMVLQVFVPMFTDGTWEALTTPGSGHYLELFGPLLIFELVVNLGFLVAYSVLAILFFRKSRFFPRTYIALAICNLSFILLDAWASSFVLLGEPMFDLDTARELSRSLVAIAIWVPYMLISKRVKNTFV